MFDWIQALIVEWGLIIAALACLAGAGAAFIYIPIFGRYVAACLVAAAAGLFAYDLGYRARGNLDNSTTIQTQLDEANRELKVIHDVQVSAIAREEVSDAQAIEMQDKINAYEAELKAAPATPECSLTDADVRSLSGIRSNRTPLPPSRPSDLR